MHGSVSLGMSKSYSAKFFWMRFSFELNNFNSIG